MHIHVIFDHWSLLGALLDPPLTFSESTLNFPSIEVSTTILEKFDQLLIFVLALEERYGNHK